MKDVVMPRLALGDEEVTIVAWLKQAGEHVRAGEPLLEVETDKATMEVESPSDGVLTSLLYGPGAVVASGTAIAQLAENETAVAQGSVEGGRMGAGAPAHDATAVSDRQSEANVRQVRHGEVAGLPQRGRPAEGRSGGPDPGLAGTFKRRELSRRRLAIARQMTAAAAIPQFSVAREIAVESWPPLTARADAAVSFSDFLVAAVGRAAQRLGAVNAWLIEDELYEFEGVNVAYAVDTPDGVVAPVLRGAHEAALDELARQRSRLVAAARENRLATGDLVGATLTLSNVGPLQADHVVPLVTPPQVAAVGVGRFRGLDGERLFMATFVGDHRALDGADGGRFLTALAGSLSELLADAGA
jgi:pyruvate/2-oxoglutarate dehydrogenase complex dihydrolipoamide acyltransferase (E2) component